MITDTDKNGKQDLRRNKCKWCTHIHKYTYSNIMYVLGSKPGNMSHFYSTVYEG